MLTIVLVKFYPYTHQGLEHLLSEFTDTNSMIRLLVARAEHLYNLLNSILLPRVFKKKKNPTIIFQVLRDILLRIKGL